MDISKLRDWFNFSAVAPVLAVLFSFLFCLFTGGHVMSPLAECLWVTGIIIIVSLVWRNAAKMQQREREAKEHERAAMLHFDEIKQLLAKPETTLADVKKVIGKGVAVGVTAAVGIRTEVTRGDKERLQ